MSTEATATEIQARARRAARLVRRVGGRLIAGPPHELHTTGVVSVLGVWRQRKAPVDADLVPTVGIVGLIAIGAPVGLSVHATAFAVTRWSADRFAGLLDGWDGVEEEEPSLSMQPYRSKRRKGEPRSQYLRGVIVGAAIRSELLRRGR